MQITCKWSPSPFDSFWYLEGTLGITLLETGACTVRKIDKMIPVLISKAVCVRPQASQIQRFWSRTLNRTMRLTAKGELLIKPTAPSLPEPPHKKAMEQDTRHMGVWLNTRHKSCLEGPLCGPASGGCLQISAPLLKFSFLKFTCQPSAENTDRGPQC